LLEDQDVEVVRVRDLRHDTRAEYRNQLTHGWELNRKSRIEQRFHCRSGENASPARSREISYY